MENLDKFILNLKNEVTQNNLNKVVFDLMKTKINEVSKELKLGDRYIRVSKKSENTFRIYLNTVYKIPNENIQLYVDIEINDERLLATNIEFTLTNYYGNEETIYNESLVDFYNTNAYLGNTQIFEHILNPVSELLEGNSLYEYLKNLVLMSNCITDNKMYVLNSVIRKNGYNLERIEDNLYKLFKDSNEYYLYQDSETNKVYITNKIPTTKFNIFIFNLKDLYNGNIERFFNEYLPILDTNKKIEYLLNITGRFNSNDFEFIGDVIRKMTVITQNKLLYRVNNFISLSITLDSIEVIIEHHKYGEFRELVEFKNNQNDLQELRNKFTLIKDLLNYLN